MKVRSSILVLIAILVAYLAACAAPQVTQSEVGFTLIVDGTSRAVEAPAGTTIQEALEGLGVELNSLDRTDPPLFTVLTEGIEVQIVFCFGIVITSTVSFSYFLRSSSTAYSIK